VIDLIARGIVKRAAGQLAKPGAAMSTQTIARIVAIAVLVLACLTLATFEILALTGRLVGNSTSGELFILMIRQEGGILDFAKQAALPVITAATIHIQFSKEKDRATPWIWGLLALYFVLTLAFFVEFQVGSISEEIWVNDARQTFVRDAASVEVNQAAFESAIRYFCYQSVVTVITYGLVLLGIQSRDKQSGDAT
jgi:hypothetical protein